MKWLLQLLERLLRRDKTMSERRNKNDTAANREADGSGNSSRHSGLPVNPPSPPDPPVGRGERWDLSSKEYDGTWRIRFPSFLARQHGVDSKTYCIVNGTHKAVFRSYDTDNGAMRPSYTMPMSVKLEFPATVVLYRENGAPIAWFQAERANTSGRLP